MKILSSVLLTASALAAPRLVWTAPVATAPAAAASTLIVLDASGSMAERIKGETKMEIAKRAVRELVASLPDGARLGLVVYGHRKPTDCDDIELLIPPAKLDRAAFVAAVDAIKPKGRTPLSAALEFAAISRERVRQIEARAFEKVQKAIKAQVTERRLQSMALGHGASKARLAERLPRQMTGSAPQL